jgi:hypothetical protein
MHWASLLLMLFLLPLVCSCAPDLFPQVRAQKNERLEQAIASKYQPYRVIQACIDTPPIFPPAYFHQAALQIADRIDALTTVNQGGLLVYVSLIEHDSLQTSVATITVSPIPPDPARPVLKPLPTSSQFASPYDYAQVSFVE